MMVCSLPKNALMSKVYSPLENSQSHELAQFDTKKKKNQLLITRLQANLSGKSQKYILAFCKNEIAAINQLILARGNLDLALNNLEKHYGIINPEDTSEKELILDLKIDFLQNFLGLFSNRKQGLSQQNINRVGGKYAQTLLKIISALEPTFSFPSEIKSNLDSLLKAASGMFYGRLSNHIKNVKISKNYIAEDNKNYLEIQLGQAGGSMGKNHILNIEIAQAVTTDIAAARGNLNGNPERLYLKTKEDFSTFLRANNLSVYYSEICTKLKNGRSGKDAQARITQIEVAPHEHFVIYRNQDNSYALTLKQRDKISSPHMRVAAPPQAINQHDDIKVYENHSDFTYGLTIHNLHNSLQNFIDISLQQLLTTKLDSFIPDSLENNPRNVDLTESGKTSRKNRIETEIGRNLHLYCHITKVSSNTSQYQLVFNNIEDIKLLLTKKLKLNHTTTNQKLSQQEQIQHLRDALATEFYKRFSSKENLNQLRKLFQIVFNLAINGSKEHHGIAIYHESLAEQDFMRVLLTIVAIIEERKSLEKLENLTSVLNFRGKALIKPLVDAFMFDQWELAEELTQEFIKQIGELLNLNYQQDIQLLQEQLESANSSLRGNDGFFLALIEFYNTRQRKENYPELAKLLKEIH